MTTELEHPECNGWVIVQSDQVDCENAANYHVVEAIIQEENDGRRKVRRYNAGHETCCGLPLIKNAKYQVGCVYFQSEVNKLRIALAEKQSGTWEICGRCVGHFYKDPEQ